LVEVFAGTIQYGSVAGEVRAAWRGALMTALVARWEDGFVQRTEPAVAFFVTHRGDHQQIPGAGSRDVSDTDAFGKLPGMFMLLVLEQFPGRGIRQVHRAESAFDKTLWLARRQVGGHIGQDDYRKF